MSAAELTWLPVQELVPAIRRRRLSPVELIDAYLDRIAAADGELCSFITVDAEGARAAAQRAEQEIAGGNYRGPLHGIPYALKDIYRTKGIRTTAGSKILANYVPDYDSTVHEKLQAAGAILVGKLHTSEFARGPAGGHPCYPRARNPWNLEHIPGGSSSGSGIAAAAGLVPIAMGTCTGGSIRIPAAFCGAVGLKPTYGRVSRYGIIPLSWSLDHAGPLGRTVAHCAAALGAIAGPDHRDSTARNLRVPDYLAELNGDVSGLRVALVKEMWAEPMDAHVRQLTTAAIDTLAGLGMQVKEISLPLVSLAVPTVEAIILAEAAQYHLRWLRERAEDYGPGLAANLLAGVGLTAQDLVLAQRVRRLVVEQFRSAMSAVDLLVSPTSPITAPRFDDDIVVLEGRQVPWRSVRSRFTRIYNLTGLPALSVPCGFAPNGLPVGLQLASKPFDEGTLLRAGHAYEQAAGRVGKRPQLAGRT